MCASHHISASTEAGSPDWRKNFLACSPTTRTSKGRNIEKQGSWDFNSLRKWCHIGITKSLRWQESHCGQWSTCSYLFVVCTWDITHGWGQTVKLLVMFFPLLWRDRPYTWATWKEKEGAKVKWWENVKDCESSDRASPWLLFLFTEYWHDHQWHVADEEYWLFKSIVWIYCFRHNFPWFLEQNVTNTRSPELQIIIMNKQTLKPITSLTVTIAENWIHPMNWLRNLYLIPIVTITDSAVQYVNIGLIWNTGRKCIYVSVL